MANKRMFSLDIVDTDHFLEMSASAQLLYFHLGMRADDEGFIGNPKKIMRMLGANEDDLKILIAKGYVIPFPSGVVVIAHWKVLNWIRSDRFHPTLYQEERDLLEYDGRGVYVLPESPQTQQPQRLHTDGMPVGCQPGYRGKNRIEEYRIEKDNVARAREGRGLFGHVLLSDKEYEALKARYQKFDQLVDKVDHYLDKSGKHYNNHFFLILKIADSEHWPRKRLPAKDPADLAHLPPLTPEQEAKMDKDVEEIIRKLAEGYGG